MAEIRSSDIRSSDIDEVVAGRTIAKAFAGTVARQPDALALRWRDGDDWRGWTWAGYADRVARVAGALADRGVGPASRVVLMLTNRPEFHVLDLAVLLCGATPISIYNSSSPDQIAYLVGDCGAQLGVVEGDAFLSRFEPVRDQLEALGSIGVVEPGDHAHDFTLADLLDHEPIDLAAAADATDPASLATVIYTSGTTGPPKGVMISNRNVMWTAHSLKLTLGWDDADFPGKRVMSYLPMAHIAERSTSHYQHVIYGTEVSCCPNPGAIASYVTDVHPHLLFGVPRVWEKIQAGVMALVGADPERAEQFSAGIETAAPLRLKDRWGEATDEEKATLAFLDDAAFGQVREQLGMDELELAISGAAPLGKDLFDWFLGVGIPMSEIYGMSETTGIMTWEPQRVKPGTVGKAMIGCEVALADDGELIVRGGQNFEGYLNQPEKTAETIDEDGWLHSGDIGEVDDDGYFRIVDRKKELIITAGGKNISPANLEAALKTIPLVGQACAIGDQRRFVAALVVLDPDTAPVWADQHGVDYGGLEDLATTEEVLAAIDEALPDAMAGFNNAERVKKVKVLATEWLPDSDELTPTSKLKRRGIHAKYAEEIDALYT